jgi:hypothetical protein
MVMGGVKNSEKRADVLYGQSFDTHSYRTMLSDSFFCYYLPFCCSSKLPRTAFTSYLRPLSYEKKSVPVAFKLAYWVEKHSMLGLESFFKKQLPFQYV